MVRTIKTAFALVALAFTFGLYPSGTHRTRDARNKAKTLETGTFHGKVHKTSGASHDLSRSKTGTWFYV